MVSGSEGCTGPWTNGAGANIPNPVGAGTHVLLVSSIGVPTDGDGDLIVGTVTLQNTGPNDAIVNFTTNPAVSIWHPLDDSEVTPGAIVISQVCYCTIDADCGDDGIGCTDEICDEGTCVSIPNDSNCPDDGMFCKGTAFCDAALDCSSTGDPCDEGENCDEENDVCVLENLPPDCSAASADPSELWSPNHKYVDIAIIDVTDADGDPVTITIDAIAQDEEVNALGMGDGNTSPDGTGVGTDTAFIMSERQGTGNGRVYEISFTAEDGNGAVCSSSVQVCVPHGKRRGNECIDDGQIYDSTDE
jgi:hypothetical protein